MTVPGAVTWPLEQKKRSSQRIHSDAYCCFSSPRPKSLRVFMFTYVLLTRFLVQKGNDALLGNLTPSSPRGQGSDLASSVISAWGRALTLQESFCEWAWSRPWGGKLPSQMLVQGPGPIFRATLPGTDAGMEKADGLMLPFYPPSSHHRRTQNQRSPQFSSTVFYFFTVSFIDR